jgi:hypothetical protein
MRTYSSYLIRCWLIRDDPQNERAVFDIEHIQTGEHLRATSLAEVYDWIMATGQTAKLKTTSPDDEEEELGSDET